MGLLFIIAFISGLVTILAPCIWPLLPIILSSSVAGGDHRRPLGITLGIMMSFAFFTLTISTVVRFFHFDPDILRLFAVVIIGFLGITMIIPAFGNVIEKIVSRLTGMWGQTGNSTGNGFVPGFITGFSLGIVWSPCAGPILATIATLAATNQITLNLILITIVYVTGVGIPLFAFAYGGQHFFTKTRFISTYTGRIQQVFGVLMVFTALAIYTNYDKVLQVKLLDFFPSYTQILTRLENSNSIKKQLDLLKGTAMIQKQNLPSESNNLFNENYPAPELIGITKWLNTDTPFTLKELRGKVVLIDFWTYTCINCIRTLPHVTAWYDKYKDQGFVVIGVHTPEFEFEKDSKNVQNAIKQYNIHYPVPQDNAYATWNNYKNQYWPAEYLIDARGNVRRTHFGEGKYDETEKAIQVLLKEARQQVSDSVDNITDQTPDSRQSPETYLGSSRMEFYYPHGKVNNGKQLFTLFDQVPQDSFSLGGNWNITDEYAIAGEKAFLIYNFTASKVHLVLRSSNNTQAKIKVFLDNILVENRYAGVDVQNGIVTVDTDRLYTLIDLHSKVENHLLKLEFQTSGVEVFAFTFG